MLSELTCFPALLLHEPTLCCACNLPLQSLLELFLPNTHPRGGDMVTHTCQEVPTTLLRMTTNGRVIATLSGAFYWFHFKV